MKLKTTITLTAAGLFASSVASAAAVNSGEFVLDFNESTLSGLSNQPHIDRFFGGSASEDKSETDMRTNPAYESSFAAPPSLTFSVLGSGTPAASGLEGRNPQASNFNFTDSSNPASSGTGTIGLGGVYTFSNTAGQQASAGDFGLAYNGTDWVLDNNVGFSIPEVFTLGNVTATAAGDDNFELSGDVFFGPANAAFTGGPGTSTDTDIGDFSFKTLLAAVPVTPAPPEPTTPVVSPEPTTPEPTTPVVSPEPTTPEPTTPVVSPEPTTPVVTPEPTTPEPTTPIVLPDPTSPTNPGGGPVAAVPVPAAVWLFGTGLIGLTSMSRRKKST